MKRISILAVLFLMTVGLNAQSLVSTAFSDYEQNENYTRVSISKKMFSLIAGLDTEDPEEKELINTVSKIDGLKIIVADSSENPDAMYKEAMSRVPKRFEELMTVDDKTEKIVFMIDEKDGKVAELIMILKGDEFVLLDLYGEIDLNKIAQVSKQMNIEHMEKLEQISEEKE